MRPSQVLTAFIALTSVTSAFPFPPSWKEIRDLSKFTGIDFDTILDRRQNKNNNNNNNNNNKNKQPAKPASTSSQPKVTDSPKTVTKGGKSSPKSSGNKGDNNKKPNKTTGGKNPSKTSGSGKKGSGKSTITSKCKVNQNHYPGGVNMIEPNTILGSSEYYSVSETVTWKWNFTSVLCPPEHINVLASIQPTAGSIGPSPYTVATNMPYKENMTLTWDTGEFNDKTPLAVATYTLVIYDPAQSGGPSAVGQPGELAPYDQFQFGMYTGQTYNVPVPSYICATCNAAAGRMDAMVLRTLFGIVGITMATILWFTGVNGVLF